METVIKEFKKESYVQSFATTLGIRFKKNLLVSDLSGKSTNSIKITALFSSLTNLSGVIQASKVAEDFMTASLT